MSERDVLRVGNCSGFYGDRLSAMREMLEGGELDVLTGDYLAELTMLILGRDQMKDPVARLRPHLPHARSPTASPSPRSAACGSSATPAGSTPPAWPTRCARSPPTRASTLASPTSTATTSCGRADELGLPRRQALTANAYLGAFGIAAALAAGADVVVTGRVTDASVVVGPGDLRTSAGAATTSTQLAGAVVAGHVIECGAQATGGNFSGFRALLDAGRRRPAAGLPARRDRRRRLLRDHQAPRHRRAGRPSTPSPPSWSTRSSRTRYLGPDVTTPARHHRARPGRRRTGSGSAASAASAPPDTLEGVPQPARRLPQPDGARAHRPRHRRQGRRGSAPRSRPPAGRRARRAGLVPRPHRPPGRRHRGGRERPAPGASSATRRPTRSARGSPPRWSSSPSRPTPASP